MTMPQIKPFNWCITFCVGVHSCHFTKNTAFPMGVKGFMNFCLFFAAFCMGGQGISKKEADWKRSVIFGRVQSPWNRKRIWMYLLTERYNFDEIT